MVFVLSLLVCSCSAAKNSDDTINLQEKDSGTVSEAPETLFAPESFSSFEAFEKHEKEKKTNAVSCYYVPSSLSKDYRLQKITKRENIYVMVEYRISAPADSTEKLSEYDAERLQTLICRYSLYADGKKALEENFLNKGYKEMQYNEKTYYRWDEHAENNPDKRIIGYEIAFLQDGNLIFLHLPAVDTFENMMKYADITRIDIR